MRKTLARTETLIFPALIVVDDRGESVSPLLVSRLLLWLLFVHQWLMVNYYAVIELRQVAGAIAVGVWLDLTQSTGWLLAGIFIKAVWWGVTP